MHQQRVVRPSRVGATALLVLVGVAGQGCSSSDPPPNPDASASLSGRYEPGPSGYSSIWFDGKATFKAVHNGVIERGSYRVAGSTLRLSLATTTSASYAFAAGAPLASASSGPRTLGRLHKLGSGADGVDATDTAEDGRCSKTTDAASVPDDGSIASTANVTVRSLRPLDEQALLDPCASDLLTNVLDGFKTTGPDGSQASSWRVGGGPPPPSATTVAAATTVDLNYLGSPEFLFACACQSQKPCTYGCGAGVFDYAESNKYFSAPSETVACGGKATFCKNGACVVATRVESSDENQRWEGSAGLLRALGGDPRSDPKSCTGSGTISGVSISY